jgi:hypothetical protein
MFLCVCSSSFHLSFGFPCWIPVFCKLQHRYLNSVRSWDSSVNIVTVLSWVQFLTGAGIFYIDHCVQTGFGAHPVSYQMGTGGSFQGVKWPVCEAHHSHPSSAEVKNTWRCTLLPQCVLMEWCLNKKRMSFIA